MEKERWRFILVRPGLDSKEIGRINIDNLGGEIDGAVCPRVRIAVQQ